ncbi:MAG: 2-dehydropantoate 2-reductase [Opitutales bacterium]
MRRRIAIVGTGAVGGWYAALLAAAGHDVRCLARRDAAVIEQSGLRIRTATGVRTQRVTLATDDPRLIGEVDLVVVAAKATANSGLPDTIRSMCGPDTTLLTLQNGMGNAEVLRQVAEADRVVAGLCFVCINRTAPGEIETTLPGYVRMAAALGPINARVDECVRLFADAGVDCRAESSLEGVLWKKLCWNIPFNGLSIAAGGLTTDQILANPALRTRARHLMDEVRAASEARGTPFGIDHIERQFAVTEGMGPYRTSSLIDYQEGREVEIESIWGIPLERGTSVGVAMPELARLLEEIRERVRSR